MPGAKNSVIGDLEALAELARSTAPPAGYDEICAEGLRRIARALGARGGRLLTRDPAEGVLVEDSRWGEADGADLAEAAEIVLESDDAFLERPGNVLAVRIPGDTCPLGAVALAAPARSDATARTLVEAAVRILGASLRAHRDIAAGRAQRELLAQRNLELEVLRELTERLVDLKSDDALLQGALDLVLEKLGLRAGWIFWGEANRAKLDLVACRGVDPRFVEEARAEGIGRCLCVDVFETGRLMFARNTLDCPRLPELVQGDAPMTHACVPLKFERGILGVMNIANRPGRVFSEQELQFLETVGSQVCLAVAKSWTARAESRANAEARALASLARATGGGLDLPRVLEAVGEYARDLLGADRCAIFLDEGSPNLRLSYVTGPPLDGLAVGEPADFQALGARLLAFVSTQVHTVVVNDSTEDSRANNALAARWGIRGQIIVPLVAHGHLQGLLMASMARPFTWPLEQVELADALGRQAAVAIENARLYRDAQEALRQLQVAQEGMVRAERLAAVGTLAASLAHEVRNPLNSINLHLVLLERRIAKLDPDRRPPLQELVDTSRREIVRLEGLVQEFLTLSTVDRLALRETDPEDAIRDVATLLGPLARERGIELRESLTGTLPPVLLDREKFKQVMINLVRNAIEAMPEGGSLWITSRRADDQVVLRVKDEGVGIPPGLDVFDLFTTTKSDGTGLGLPIARRIVEAHGGSLTYESVPGEGTTFTVSLKIA